MAVEKVELTVSSIKELLETGYTWLKKDDLGFGSIQEKFGATDVQISTIRKHPLLKNLETVAKIFVIIDDTKNDTTTLSTDRPVSNRSVGSVPEHISSKSGSSNELLPRSSSSDEETLATTDADGFSAFANL